MTYIKYVGICNILLLFGIFYGHLVCFSPFWYVFPRFGMFFPVLVCFSPFWYVFTRFGMFYQEKSGNPAQGTESDSMSLAMPF
jgi:hypothetical protein